MNTEERTVAEEILNAARQATSTLLPAKSKEQYQKCNSLLSMQKWYSLFCEWRRCKMVNDVDENLMLAYFFEKAKHLKASSLWSMYSMIKSTLQINENKDISKYQKLIAFLKRQNDEYQPKKSSILTIENVTKFLKEAPDSKFLLMKVVLIFGVSGACRRGELCALKVEDIHNSGSILIVTLHDTKTKKKSVFMVTTECNGIELYRKYFKLRPSNVGHGRLFLFYKNGKCSVQPVGINSFAKMPSKIAEYLKLANPSSYTGHCLRRTSATFLADSGADIQMLKRHGGWNSTSVSEGYVEDSIANKIRTSKRIFNEAESNPVATSFVVVATSSSEVNQANSSLTELQSSAALNVQSSSITFSNLSNCVFNIHHDQNK